MKKSIVILSLVTVAASALSQTFINQSVYATEDIYRASGYTPSGDGGINPSVFNLTANPGVLTFALVSGSITLQSSQAYNDPDGTVISGMYGSGPYGTGDSFSDNNDWHGLSGIYEPGAGGLVGVFLSPTSLSGSTPSILNFTTSTHGGIAPIGDSEANLSPALDQVFLIGDGLTADGTGTVQTFFVPSGATELVLGISDAVDFDGINYASTPGAYGDNSGSFTASFSITTVPESGSMALLSGIGSLVLVAWRRRK
jgi:hypothetical protein